MNREREDNEEETEKRNPIVGDSTPIRLGFVILLLGICAGGFGMWIWWAASISTKLDVVMKQNDQNTAAYSAMSIRVTAIELWQKGIDSTGSPAMVKKVEELERGFSSLQREFDMHKVSAASKGSP